jgi:hypothetical protein
MMARSDFESTWVPRIGNGATAALRRYWCAGGTVPAIAIVLGVAATYAFAGNTLDKLLGVVLLAGAVGAFAIFVRTQRKLAAALSEWFGVKITGGRLPKMNPKRFDAWREERGLHTPREGLSSGRVADALDTAQRDHGSSSSSTVRPE